MMWHPISVQSTQVVNRMQVWVSPAQSKRGASRFLTPLLHGLGNIAHNSQWQPLRVLIPADPSRKRLTVMMHNFCLIASSLPHLLLSFWGCTAPQTSILRSLKSALSRKRTIGRCDALRLFLEEKVTGTRKERIGGDMTCQNPHSALLIADMRHPVKSLIKLTRWRW